MQLNSRFTNATFFKCNLMLLFIVGPQLFGQHVAVGHRCYVCGGENETSCEGLNISENSEYAKDCPARFKACRIVDDGSNIKRSCERLNLDDCQTANDIKYCYCTRNLCNYKIDELFRSNSLGYDDEDSPDPEGSGSRKFTTTTTISTLDINNEIQGKSNVANLIANQICFYMFFVMFF